MEGVQPTAEKEPEPGVLPPPNNAPPAREMPFAAVAKEAELPTEAEEKREQMLAKRAAPGGKGGKGTPPAAGGNGAPAVPGQAAPMPAAPMPGAPVEEPVPVNPQAPAVTPISEEQADGMDDSITKEMNIVQNKIQPKEMELPRRIMPEGGVMSVGRSFYVNMKGLNPAQAEKQGNETNVSMSTSFVKSECDSFDQCLQVFNDVQCGGAPVSQQGVPLNKWHLAETQEAGCYLKPDKKAEEMGTKQSCLLWEEYFVKVTDDGSVYFKWESMSNNAGRTTIIPPIKVAEPGKCFNRCNILRHPLVLKIAEPTFHDDGWNRPEMIVEFARVDGCPCCDLEPFFPNNRKCSMYEFDAYKKQWEFSERVDGKPWTKGPECVEYNQKLDSNDANLGKKLESMEIASTTSILVDPVEEGSFADNMTDINANALSDRELGIHAGSAAPPAPVPPEEYKAKWWGKFNLDDKRHQHKWPKPLGYHDLVPVTEEQDPNGDEKKASKEDETLDEEIEDQEDPDKYHGPIPPDHERRAKDIVNGFSVNSEELQPDWGGKRGQGSLKREVPATVPPPAPPPPPPPPSKEMQKVEEDAKAREDEEKDDGKQEDSEGNEKLVPGLLYTPDPNPPSPPPAHDAAMDKMENQAYDNMNQIREVLHRREMKKQIDHIPMPPMGGHG